MAPAKKELTIVDTVTYQRLVPGKEYKLTGTLMDQENGEFLLVDGKIITSELVFTPEAAEGSVALSFTFDSRALKGKTIVAFESLSYQEKEVAVHADIESEPQSIYIPEIGTTAKDGKDGDQEALAEKETPEPGECLAVLGDSVFLDMYAQFLEGHKILSPDCPCMALLDIQNKDCYDW